MINAIELKLESKHCNSKTFSKMYRRIRRFGVHIIFKKIALGPTTREPKKIVSLFFCAALLFY